MLIHKQISFHFGRTVFKKGIVLRQIIFGGFKARLDMHVSRIIRCQRSWIIYSTICQNFCNIYSMPGCSVNIQ